MRFSPRRILAISFVIFVSLITIVYLSRRKPEFTRTCNQTEQFQLDLLKFTVKVHEILEELQLTHFLCYGALWGQIRLSRVLPWAEMVEIGILNHELTTKDEVYLDRVFRKQGLDLDYDLTEGQYVVSSESVQPNVVLVVFELDKLINKYRRVGWKRRVLPPDCEGIPILSCFPPRLVEPPLPLKKFGPISMPVPREGIEIQKYHYRDNWWKEVVEYNC